MSKLSNHAARLTLLSALSLTLSSVCGGCERASEATEAECRALFERLVTLELQEMGYRDEALAERWRVTLSQRYQGHIQTCVGRPLPPDALTCAERVRHAEELTHECLQP